MDENIDVSSLLERAGRGDAAATGQLTELLYNDLRREAERQFSAEPTGGTLQPTALIHESYLRLIRQSDAGWNSREHFLAVASQMMRRVLTDHARSRLRQKRGGQLQKIPLYDQPQVSLENPEDVLAVHEALEKLESLDSRQARIVELRYFAGLTNAEVASIIGVSLRTVEADWAMARAWLRRELSADDEAP